MTTLAPPPPAGPVPPRAVASPSGDEELAGGRRHRHEDRRQGRRTAVGRTLVGLLASALAILPLKTLFSDTGWLIDAWSAMAVVLLPAALLRARRPAGALDIWPGIVLLVPYLTFRFLRAHAWAGFIPTTGSWHQISRLMTALHRTTHDEVAPVHTTIAIRLVLCALVGLLAALIDLVAVVGHRGALAGVPILVVFTISGAVPRTPVPWYWFVFAAAGFLLLLALGAEDDVEGWGRRIRSRTRRSSGSTASFALSVTAQRIAIGALVAAVVLPLLAPSHARNLLANAFHHHGSGVGGFGDVGAGGSISPFAALQGQLARGTPVDLMTVHVDAPVGESPFYLRVNVLSKFEPDGWHVSDYGGTAPLESQPPVATTARTVGMHARITISGLDSNVPVFALPQTVSGVPAGTAYSRQDDLLLGSTVQRGQVIDETFAQPEPTLAQLRGAVDAGYPRRTDVPTYVKNLVSQLTAKATGPYERALAIQHYFVDPRNQFKYDLTSSIGDSGSALVDFLQGRHGYCQQFAAAMAVMLQVSGIPSRVVLGYMHDAPDSNGNFTITSDDAHAWVEAYFQGLGWIPFDPTPPAGLALGAENALPWAPDNGGGPVGNPGLSGVNQPHETGSGTTTAGTTSSPSAITGRHHKTHAAAASGSGLPAGAVLVAIIVVVLLVLLLVPAFVRLRRRRRRLAAVRRGDTEALWAELSDTAVDLGYVWSPARSPRQVAQWLGRDVRSSRAALQTLAAAVEHGRYAPPAAADGGRGATADGRDLQERLRAVTGELRQRRTGRTRLGAVLLPASLTTSLRWWPHRPRPRRRR